MFDLWTSPAGAVDFGILALVTVLAVIFGGPARRGLALAVLAGFLLDRAAMGLVPGPWRWVAVSGVELAFIALVLHLGSSLSHRALAVLAFLRMGLIAALLFGAATENVMVQFGAVALYFQLVIVALGGRHGSWRFGGRADGHRTGVRHGHSRCGIQFGDFTMTLSRVIIHWTGGSYLVSALDRQHYHFIVGGDGKVVPGIHKPEANLSTADGDYAAHTLHCNMGSIGISMACMGNAVEGKSDGPWPMKEVQFKAMIAKVAELAKAYKIPVKEKTVLTHAEVQPVLGITQRGKWDVTRIPFLPDLKGHKACGDHIRELVKAAMGV